MIMHFNRQKLPNKKRLKIRPRNKPVVEIKHIPRIKRSKKVISRKRRYKNVEITKRRKISRYKTLNEWEGCLKGHPAFILGNAPSISNEKLNILDPYFTIGVNRIFYIYDPTILLWQDKEVLIKDSKKLMKQKAVKVCRDISDPRNMFVNFKLILGKFKFEKNLYKLYGQGNTGALAVQIAILLGCSSVVLLGMDCKYGDKGKTDFYGRNKDHKWYTLKMCNAAMKWIKKKCPVPVYNCSNIDLWERKELKKVIKELNPYALNRDYFLQIFGRK